MLIDGRARKKHTECQRRSEEHTSELQSLMRLSYAVFCLKKKKTPLSYKIPIRNLTSFNNNLPLSNLLQSIIITVNAYIKTFFIAHNSHKQDITSTTPGSLIA